MSRLARCGTVTQQTAIRNATCGRNRSVAARRCRRKAAIPLLLIAAALNGTAAAGEHSAELQLTFVLEQERDGNESRRREILRSVLQNHPDFAPARWHSGYTRVGDEWVPFASFPDIAAGDDALHEYRHIRAEFPEDAEGRLKLAAWCRGRGLADQERAHLVEVLELEPDHAVARQRLGHQRVGGMWMSRAELSAAEKQSQVRQEALQAWQHRVSAIREGLMSPHTGRRNRAIAELKEIDSPSAAPALELLLSDRHPQLGIALVDTLDRIGGSEATWAIARRGLLSPYESVRTAAANALRTKNRHHFIPALLDALHTPIQSRAMLFRGGSQFVYRHIFTREHQGGTAVAVLDTVSHAQRRTANPDRFNIQRRAFDDNRLREQAAQQENERAHARNSRICTLLSKATDVDLAPIPELWWHWWNSEQAVYVGDKSWHVSYHTEYRSPDSVPLPPPLWQSLIGGHRARPSSCLIAGTKVWTEFGATNVEQIQVGDRVLSKHPATGELDYRPVVGTTVRPPSELLVLDLGAERIHCTLGHPYWISGKGWRLAKDLAVGDRFHTATGTVEIRGIVRQGKAAAYNLLVEDFHTYFVGASLILSHDNTAREPTDQRVPGLAAE